MTAIYTLWANTNKAASFVAPRDHLDLYPPFYWSEPLASRWRMRTLSVDYTRGPLDDFPHLAHHIPVVSERTWKVLDPLVGSVVEALPLRTRKGRHSYFALHPLLSLDCLNLPLCEFDFRSSGDVREVLSYEFKPRLISLSGAVTNPSVGGTQLPR